MIPQKHLLMLITCTALLLSAGSESKADFSVATTIRPLQFIALAILGENAEVSALIDANSTPHHFNLSPSDRLSLDRADLIVWIGAELETHFSDTLASLDPELDVITASEIPNLVLHTIGVNQQLDAHIWLDTRNANAIADQIAKKASAKDPANADFYQLNLQTFNEASRRLADQIDRDFSKRPPFTFAVYHNAFQYFENQFRINHRSELVADPEHNPSIAQIVATRRALQDIRPTCLVSEPDANGELIETILGGYKRDHELREIKVDLLGATIEPSSTAYLELISNVAGAFSNCLDLE